MERRSPLLARWGSSCAIAATAVLLMLALPTTTTVAVATTMDNNAAPPSPGSTNVTAICEPTPYPRASGMPHDRDADDPFAASVQFAMSRAASARALARNLSSASSSSSSSSPPPGAEDCAELLDITLDQLRDALAAGGRDPDGASTWLSAALTNQATCADSLTSAGRRGSGSSVAGGDAVRARVDKLSQFIATALALHVGTKRSHNAAAADDGVVSESPLPSAGGAFPSWVTRGDRKLLEAPAGAAADAVVALDGSGTHRSINEAIAAVVNGGGRGETGRKVVHVRAGHYEESVTVSSKQKNVMLVGDGKGKTVIVGHKSVGDGYTTYASATVAAMGSGFIAKGLTIENTAGPGKGQAVALRVGGDLSVVYDCAINAYQDTLYAHSNRQFYASSSIAGTVDFIFGNAAVVLQNCDIRARRPAPGQKDTVTAQGRTDPNQNTGISIHRCRVTGAPDLGGAPVYLGRPWKKYSRTVVMESFLDGSVSPAGWLEWSGGFALSTLYYGEYGNTGPGAGTGKRVTWAGVHASMATSDATRFTVAEFIAGDSWLGGTGVSYTSGL